MNPLRLKPMVHCHIIESGIRWQRAIRYFLSTTNRLNEFSVACWDLSSITSMHGQLAEGPKNSYLIIWEITSEPSRFMQMVEEIALVTQRFNYCRQVANVSANHSDVALAVQQAGVSVILEDLWSLHTIIDRLDLG